MQVNHVQPALKSVKGKNVVFERRANPKANPDKQKAGIRPPWYTPMAADSTATDVNTDTENSGRNTFRPCK